MSLNAETGPSNVEDNDDDDSQFRTSQPAAIPMDVDAAGPDEANDSGEEEWVAEMVQMDSVAAQVAATLVGLVVYGASSDNGSGEEEEEKEKASAEKSEKKNTATRMKDEKTGDADNEREEEPVNLNQRLRQGKTQPAMHTYMHTYMVEMEEEGLLELVDKKCDRCCSGHQCLLPVKSDNGHPTCAECLISSHGCLNHIAHSAPARKKPTHSSKGKAKAGTSSSPIKHLQVFVLVLCLKPSGHPPTANEPTQPEADPSTMPTALDFMVEFQSFHSHPMQERPTPGHDPVTDFTFNLAERCLGGLTHPRVAVWDCILALMHQLIAAHWVLELVTLTACSQLMKNTVKGAWREKETPESASQATGFLGQWQGGNPSWVDDLGGHSTLGTLRNFATDDGIALKEEEVDFLIDRQYLHKIEEP
ncbi:hypothetical protein ARMGADRAFT_1076721 [Armillaria gallica]|uniref:Uncharacterized protein n=1 Tax=Armillaria gallica TaxID=47427 RepID=A0A2H3DMU1_ARMGA|nr:hypothetical protein ARMGADRAFT_1076721 [Armillaria gallica]